MTYDDTKQVNTFNGNAVLIRGSLTTKAEKIIVTNTPEGHQIATLFAPESGLATFRQKRDGGNNLWIEAQAKRIEYNNKTEQVKFFSKARLRLLNGNKVTDEVEGELISYNGLTEFFSVNGNHNERANTGRVRAMLNPLDEKEKSK
jgi:lipopolysaccharide export system protein LptA